ncbi:hypothetical protein FACS1894116_10080 [Betaproteobacteria bacterium]|nr:hypothetical protein AGMMS49543_25390 [Betaproteobacteria bacterium]GHT95101.1 hypothetical protein FACS1894116_10080 [Betaproteobacteria bacterium]GHU03848.1 hypothetical protein AGMMS49960_18770 [Betaproteobacteria bacterium]GHU24627.1 hypothetical protein FACS189488_09700 [Betaproteobacteria bacterium]GHU30038.1 hypothetical protein FACS189497_09130 [Betaproteobacteria bacterium]
MTSDIAMSAGIANCPALEELEGGSPATPDELRKRFDALISDRSKGKDASKLRFMIE